MNQNKPASKIITWILICAMIIAVSPITAGAQGSGIPLGASGDITAFAALDAATKNQTVPLGTALAELTLPNTLTATVVAPTDSGGPAEADEDIPVTWDSSPAYDGDTADTYIFTAVIDGYTVSAALPTITVTVGGAEEDPPAPVIITGFDPEPYHQPDDPGATNIAVDFGTPEGDIPLPMTLNATVEGGGEYAYAVAVASWECTQIMDESYLYVPGGYDPNRNSVYVFTPTLALGANESIADGVTPPDIEVVVMPEGDVAFVPTADAASLEATINNYGNTSGGAATSWLAAAVGNTVTVTGSITGATNTLTLDIDSGVTVKWQAELYGISRP